MIQEGLHALLAADTSVAAIVNGRIFEILAPDDRQLYPCLSYTLVGGSSEPTMGTSGVLRERIEINALCLEPAAGKSPYTIAAYLRAAVIQAVNGWQQNLSDGTRVLNTVLLNPGTDFCTEDRIFRCMVEFYVLYTLPN